MRRGLKDMLHDHHNAIPSEEADLIEHEIETGLEQFQMTLGEFRVRMINNFRPEKVLSKRWVWIAFIFIYGSWKLHGFFNRKKSKRLKLKKRKVTLAFHPQSETG
jgi:hypothetical protein